MDKYWSGKGENSTGVAHWNWESSIYERDINELINWAKHLDTNKARICLHETPRSLMQVTYLAFIKPYSDKVHKHPSRPEVLIPVRGRAIRRVYSEGLELIKEELMKSGTGESFSTSIGEWHSLEVVSEEFVMIEIGLGPFTPESTVYA